jgi:co-chaperonin GroES (HSP10)
MPTSAEVQAQISKPQITRLKALGSGVRVQLVLGDRVLIKTIVPFTDMDRVEKAGILYIPEEVKQQLTPLPSTGLVVQIGEGVSAESAALLQGAAVMFSKFAGTDFIVDEEDYKLLDTAEVMCILAFDEPVVPVTG